MAGRRFEKEPDASTPDGQWALWLRTKLPSDFNAQEFADAIGKARSVVFKWLRGDAVPHISDWPTIAEALGLPGWWSLCPPKEFIDKVNPPKRGRKKSG